THSAPSIRCRSTSPEIGDPLAVVQETSPVTVDDGSALSGSARSNHVRGPASGSGSASSTSTASAGADTATASTGAGELSTAAWFAPGSSPSSTITYTPPAPAARTAATP